jgi:GAF domain-containing protein
MVITKEMRALLSLSAELQRQQTVDAMLDRLVERAAEILHADHVSVHFLDAARTSLSRHARAGNPYHENNAYEFVNGEGLIGWVAKHGAPLRADRAEDDERFKRRPDQKKPIGAFLAVPLVECGECIGVLSAVSSDEGHFTQDHEDMLLLIGDRKSVV